MPDTSTGIKLSNALEGIWSFGEEPEDNYIKQNQLFTLITSLFAERKDVRFKTSFLRLVVYLPWKFPLQS